MTRPVLRLAVLFTLPTAMAAPMLAKTIELDAVTIADINAAFDAGTLTAEKLVQMCLARAQMGSVLQRAVAQTGDAFGKSRGWLKKLRDASDKLRETIAPRVDHRSTYQRSSEREE